MDDNKVFTVQAENWITHFPNPFYNHPTTDFHPCYTLEAHEFNYEEENFNIKAKEIMITQMCSYFERLQKEKT